MKLCLVAPPPETKLCVWISWALGECSVTLSVQGGGRPFGRGNGSDGKLAKVYGVLMSPIFKTDLPAQTGINRKILVGDFARLFAKQSPSEEYKEHCVYNVGIRNVSGA